MVVVVLLDESGLLGLKFPEDLGSEELLSHKQFVKQIARPLQKLDAAIKDSSKQ